MEGEAEYVEVDHSGLCAWPIILQRIEVEQTLGQNDQIQMHRTATQHMSDTPSLCSQKSGKNLKALQREKQGMVPAWFLHLWHEGADTLSVRFILMGDSVKRGENVRTLMKRKLSLSLHCCWPACVGMRMASSRRSSNWQFYTQAHRK